MLLHVVWNVEEAHLEGEFVLVAAKWQQSGAREERPDF